MGGSGSGQWYRSGSKPTPSNFLRLSASDLKRLAKIEKGLWTRGGWNWSRGGEVCSSIGYEINTREDFSWLRVHYSNKNSGRDYDYKIPLVTTRPHYGGERWWFLCPAQGCARRVGVLFLSHIFTCRHCCNLAYTTQNESPAFRMLSRAQKIHRQLGGEGCVDYVPKPKGMHWKTYRRKVEQMHRIHDASLHLMARQLGIFPL